MTDLVDRAYKSNYFASQKESSLNDIRMSAKRCGYLISVSMVNRLNESWISIQPILWLFYAAQYFPSLFRL